MGTWGEYSATSEGGSFFSLTSFVRRSESPRIFSAQWAHGWVPYLQLGSPPLGESRDPFSRHCRGLLPPEPPLGTCPSTKAYPRRRVSPGVGSVELLSQMSSMQVIYQPLSRGHTNKVDEIRIMNKLFKDPSEPREINYYLPI